MLCVKAGQCPDINLNFVPRPGHVTGQRSVCGGRQAEFCSLPFPLPLHTQRLGVCPDENHNCAQAAARILGVPVPCGHPWWRALRSDEPHDSSVWNSDRDGVCERPSTFVMCPRYILLAWTFNGAVPFCSFLLPFYFSALQTHIWEMFSRYHYCKLLTLEDEINVLLNS